MFWYWPFCILTMQTQRETFESCLCGRCFSFCRYSWVLDVQLVDITCSPQLGKPLNPQFWFAEDSRNKHITYKQWKPLYLQDISKYLSNLWLSRVWKLLYKLYIIGACDTYTTAEANPMFAKLRSAISGRHRVQTICAFAFMVPLLLKRNLDEMYVLCALQTGNTFIKKWLCRKTFREICCPCSATGESDCGSALCKPASPPAVHRIFLQSYWTIWSIGLLGHWFLIMSQTGSKRLMPCFTGIILFVIPTINKFLFFPLHISFLWTGCLCFIRDDV